jgi:ABC-2 type transport system ATP-binding protein
VGSEYRPTVQADLTFGRKGACIDGAGLVTFDDVAGIIELRDVGKRFGSAVALANLSLSIKSGSVVGVLGPNGAGKTILLGIAAGLIRPSQGVVAWRGRPVTVPFASELRRQIGVVSQETALYGELTVWENLQFAAQLFGVSDRARIDAVLQLLGLVGRARDRTAILSGGTQRRVALARAMIHDPAFLILDEPTLGVDVEARHALWGHVRSLRRMGKTVLVSTNHLDEAEALCDRIVVLRDGRQVAEGAPAQLLSRTGRLVEIDCVDGQTESVRKRIAGLKGVRRIDVTDIGLTVHVASDHSPDALAALAMASDKVQSVRVRAPDMLEVFQALTAGPVA